MTPFIGPSYQLASRPASVQRTVNMIPVPLEAGNERTQFVFKDLPGLTLFADLGGAIRGAINVNGRVFAVAGNELKEVFSDGTSVTRGTLGTTTGVVDMTANTTQLVFTDGVQLYVMPLGSTVVQTAASYPGGKRIGYIDQYIVYLTPNTQQFGWSALGDATSLDALDFASAEGSPDSLVSLLVDHRELWLFGVDTVEVWINTGSEAVFERNSGAFIQFGCAAAQTPQRLDNSVYWLGKGEGGGYAVYRAQGYTPQRISTRAIEEVLTGRDVAEARAYTYQQDGSSFYCLKVPGLETVWCFDALSGLWHERAELDDGEYIQHRAECAVFAFNRNMVGGSDGKLYVLDPEAHSLNGDELVRDRIAPVMSVPSRKRIRFARAELTSDKGQGGTALLRWSDDNGATWGNWHQASLGEVGEFTAPTRWNRLGSAVDRVFHLRCTDNVSFNPVDLHFEVAA